MNNFTEEEMVTYLNQVYDRLLEHRYRYYVLAAPLIPDSEYDWIERYYNELVDTHGGTPMEMVDFDSEDPRAIEAAKRVDNKEDFYGQWIAGMWPVWDKLGQPKYRRPK